MRQFMFSLIAVSLVVIFSDLAMAAEAGTAGQTGSMAKAFIALGSGLAIAIAAFGAALGQGRMAAAAMESIGRNPNAAPRIQLPMILGLAFIEALAIYALIIAFALQGKI